MQKNFELKKPLNVVFLVRKRDDYRVTTDVSWYVTCLNALFEGKDKSWKTEDMVLACTFNDRHHDKLS